MLTPFSSIVSVHNQVCIARLTAPETEIELGLCPYRNIPTSTTSDECFETIRQWIRDCKENHQACILPSASQLPARLLYLGGPNPQLVENIHEQAEYLALSYCWGDSSENPFLKTYGNTLESHKKCIMLGAMPQNFRDAIYVSKRLGYNYLWIDSLCIIQDDGEDWDVQSKLMGDIYHGADLVIAASRAPAAFNGFLAERQLPCNEGTVSMALEDNEQPVVFCYRLSPPHRSCEDELDSRAWAFQERLRACRYLAFGKRELTWSCQTTLHCECDSAEVVDESRKYRERSLEFSLSQSTAQDLHMRWRQDIITFYTQRKLTHHEDKLRALSAIADYFQAKIGGKYLAGLWEQDFILDLLWSTDDAMRREDFKIPTWSWMACAGLAYYPLVLTFNVVRLATLVRSHIFDTPLGMLGIPQLGVIVLLGKLAPAILTHDPSARIPNKGGPFRVSVLNISEFASWVVNPDIFPPAHQSYSIYSETSEPSESSLDKLEGQPYNVWVLFMAFFPSKRYLYGIILTKSAEFFTAYCRVGLVIFRLGGRYGNIHEILKQWGNEQVTIV